MRGDSLSYCVYMHTCPNGKVYIGITCQNPINRWGNGYHYTDNKHFYRAIVKYGWDNIKHEILFTNLTKEEACEKEIELIAEYKSNNPDFGYNHALGGEMNVGWHHSEEAKARMSEKHKLLCGENSPLYGRTLGEEHRRKIGESKKGKEPWNKGKALNYENNFTKNRHKVINLDTGEIFESVKAARIKYNAVKIPRVCLGKRNKSGGYRWAYYEGGDAL